MKWIAAALVTVAFATPLSAQNQTDPNLNKLAAAFADAFNKKDAAAVAAFYTEDAMLMPPDAPMVKGRTAIQAHFQRDFDRGITDLKLTPFQSSISGQFAFEAGTSNLQVQAATGNPGGLSLLGVGGGGSAAVRSQGKYLVVYRRVANDWKIAFDIYNDDAGEPTAKP